MLVSALGLCGVGSIPEVKRVIPEKFSVRKRGYLMQCLEREREIHLQVCLDRLIKVTDKSGENYFYDNFDNFYDEAKARDIAPGNGHDESVSSDLIAITRHRQKPLRRGDNSGR